MQSLLFVVFLLIASLQGTLGAPSCKAKSGHHRHHHHSGSLSYTAPTPSGSTNQSTNAPANVKGIASTPVPSTPSSTPSAAPASQAASTTPASNSSSVSSAEIEAYLTAHNTVRAQHGAVPLTWSDSLSHVAQAWADGCKFQHSGGQFGENLAAGTGDSYTIKTAVQSWADEASQYDPNNPQYSHFTQMVWKGTTQLGCAHQDCSGIFGANYGLAHYHVCEYSPPGNVIGEFAQNVKV